MTDDPLIEEARRQGFQRGCAVAFFWVSFAATLYTTAWTRLEISEYVEVYEQVKVPMPGLTVLLLENHALIASGLVLALAFCAYLTFTRKFDARTTLLLNAVLFVVAVSWTALASIAIKLPWFSLLQGIGKGRR